MLIVRFFILIMIIFISQANSEIIENKQVFNKKFDIWNISCEEDEMFNNIRCRMFVEITEKTTLFINPESNENKILLISEDGYYDTKFFIKIDNNKLITSQNYTNNKYNIVNFNKNDVDAIYSQLKNGQNFYMRFTIKDNLSLNGFKEITAKFSLVEFQKALAYYNKQVNKYNLTINNIN